MHLDQNRRVITLSNHAAFEKCQTSEKSYYNRKGAESGSFVETLFGLLGEKRRLIVSYVVMKLDRRRRHLFKADLANASNFREECRCVKIYMSHLSGKDLNTLIAWIRRLLAEKIDAVAFPGETDPDRRLHKFARTFGLDHAKVDHCMLFLLLAS